MQVQGIKTTLSIVLVLWANVWPKSNPLEVFFNNDIVYTALKISQYKRIKCAIKTKEVKITSNYNFVAKRSDAFFNSTMDIYAEYRENKASFCE